MDWPLIVLTLLCFVGGIIMSRWQARRAFKQRVVERVAQEAERELARRAADKLSEKDKQALVAELLAAAQEEMKAGSKSKPV